MIFQEDNILLTGSFSFEISLTEYLMFSILSLFKRSLSIRLFFNLHVIKPAKKLKLTLYCICTVSNTDAQSTEHIRHRRSQCQQITAITAAQQHTMTHPPASKLTLGDWCIISGPELCTTSLVLGSRIFSHTSQEVKVCVLRRGAYSCMRCEFKVHSSQFKVQSIESSSSDRCCGFSAGSTGADLFATGFV